MLICCKAADVGLFKQNRLAEIFDSGQEADINATLEEKMKNDASNDELKIIKEVINEQEPDFAQGLLSALRLGCSNSLTGLGMPINYDPRVISNKYDWKDLFNPIFKKASVKGFVANSKICAFFAKFFDSSIFYCMQNVT